MKYYAVYGKNGFGIFNNYASVRKNKQFLREFNVKKFLSKADAIGYSIQLYNECQMYDECVLPDKQEYRYYRMNWIYFNNDIRGINSGKKGVCPIVPI